MKRLLEGCGYSTEVKYGEVTLEYIDSAVVITTNTLPFKKLKKIDKEAFETRCHLIDLSSVKISESNQLPFAAIDLAKYFMARLEEDKSVANHSQDQNVSRDVSSMIDKEDEERKLEN